MGIGLGEVRSPRPEHEAGGERHRRVEAAQRDRVQADLDEVGRCRSRAVDRLHRIGQNRRAGQGTPGAPMLRGDRMLILDLADEGHVLRNGSVVLSGRARGTGGDACFGCAAA